MIIREDNYYSNTKWFEEGYFPVLEENYNFDSSLNKDINYIQLDDLSYLSESYNNSIFSLEYSKLHDLCEKYDLEYNEAINLLCENNQISNDSILLNIKDYELIENPYLLEEVDCNYALSEISDDSFEYLLAEQCLLEFLDGDEDAFDLMLEDADIFLYCLFEDAHPRKFNNKRLIGKSIDRAVEKGEEIRVPNGSSEKVQDQVKKVINNKKKRAERNVIRNEINAKTDIKKNGVPEKYDSSKTKWYGPGETITSILSRATGKGTHTSLLPGSSIQKEIISNTPNVKKAKNKLKNAIKAKATSISQKVANLDPRYHDKTSIKYKNAMKVYNSILGKTTKQNFDFDSSINGRMRKGEHGDNLEERISKDQSGLFMPVKRKLKFGKMSIKKGRKKEYLLKHQSTTTASADNNTSGNKLMKYGKYGLAAAGIAGAAFAANKFIKQAQNKPRTWIAKKIAALRSIYSKFMTQAQRNPQKAGAFKRIAAKILSVIDKLMAKLQHATN